MEEELRNSLNLPEEDARDSNSSLGKMKLRRSNKGNNIDPNQLPNTTDRMIGNSIEEESVRNSGNRYYR